MGEWFPDIAEGDHDGFILDGVFGLPNTRASRYFETSVTTRPSVTYWKTRILNNNAVRAAYLVPQFVAVRSLQ